jgi:hypothetical protein
LPQLLPAAIQPKPTLMFSYHVVQVLAFVICIPALLGLARFNKTPASFRPFVYYIWFGLVNEIISAILPSFTGNNAVNSNIYVLIEGLALLWVFYQWTFQSPGTKKLYIVFALAFVLLWLLDNCWLNPITKFNSVYRVFYSFIIVVLSINQLNLQIITERGSLFKNAIFLVCTGFIIFFSYRMVFEVFYLFELQFSTAFYNNLFDVLIIINLVCNLIYALAIAWIPTKQRFTLPY